MVLKIDKDGINTMKKMMPVYDHIGTGYRDREMEKELSPPFRSRHYRLGIQVFDGTMTRHGQRVYRQ